MEIVKFAYNSNEEHRTEWPIVYRHFLAVYSLEEIESALRWLEYGGYFAQAGTFGIMSMLSEHMSFRILNDQGCAVYNRGRFSDEERKLFYRDEEPYAVFIAHQFIRDDEQLVEYIQKRVLSPIGMKLVSGRVDGLEEFRHTILKKIKECRFFLCLLTKRVELPSGEYASSLLSAHLVLDISELPPRSHY